MRLRAADDAHNVYVLYSDLLFNLLILFLIIVLALVLRMHSTIEAVRVAQVPVPASPEGIVDQQAELRSQRGRIAQLEGDLARAESSASRASMAAEAALASLQSRLANARTAADVVIRQAKAQQQSTLTAVAQQLAIAAGANRFTGRTGSTDMCIAVDLSGTQPMFVPISASAFQSAGATLDGESDDQHKLRSARLLHAALDGTTRFTADQFRGLFEALDTRPSEPGASDDNHEGTLLFSYGGQATLIASGWEDQSGDVNVDAFPADIRSKFEDHSFAEYHRNLVDQLIKARDQWRSDRRPESVPVLHFTARVDGAVQVGRARYTVAEFRQIVSSMGDGGVILQYDPAIAGTTCPDWVIQKILTQTGYTNAVPDPDELQRLRQSLPGSPSQTP